MSNMYKNVQGVEKWRDMLDKALQGGKKVIEK